MNNITLQGDEMLFLNCTISVPKEKGFHIVSSGCGSGKTTMISEITSSRWSEGILIVVPTIKAADELLERIDSKLTGKDKMMCKIRVLNCERILEMDEYKKEPQGLADYDVLIVTSVRLIIDPYKLFLNYKEGGTRKYVLLDEIMNFFPPGFEIPRQAQDIFTFVDECKTHNGKKGTAVTIEGRKFYRHVYQDAELMKAAYLSSKHKFFSQNNELNRYKANTIIEHIHNYGFSPIRNKIKDFAELTTVIMFDGTSDCLFKSDDSRLIPVRGKRYSSDIHFRVFNKRLRRKNNEFWNKDHIIKFEQEFFDTVKDAVSYGKTLIVTWKTLDIFKNNTGEADVFEHDAKTSYNFPKILEESLVGAGIDGNMFSIIYRGSGQDRGSNEYRDYASVIFFGEWMLPDNIVGDINTMFQCRCSYRDYMKSLVIQTICRLRIRLHRGEPVNVYFSSDINYNLMYETQKYFEDNSSEGCVIEGIKKPCNKLSKTEKVRILEIVSLYDYDNGIRDAIESGSAYNFTITLDELYKHVKRDRKAKDRYHNLIKELADRYNITMNIG